MDRYLRSGFALFAMTAVQAVFLRNAGANDLARGLLVHTYPREGAQELARNDVVWIIPSAGTELEAYIVSETPRRGYAEQELDFSLPPPYRWRHVPAASVVPASRELQVEYWSPGTTPKALDLAFRIVDLERPPPDPFSFRFISALEYPDSEELSLLQRESRANDMYEKTARPGDCTEFVKSQLPLNPPDNPEPVWTSFEIVGDGATPAGLLGFYMGETFVPPDCKGVLWTSYDGPTEAVPLFLNGDIGEPIALAPEQLEQWQPPPPEWAGRTQPGWCEHAGLAGSSRPGNAGDVLLAAAALALNRRRG